MSKRYDLLYEEALQFFIENNIILNSDQLSDLKSICNEGLLNKAGTALTVVKNSSDKLNKAQGVKNGLKKAAKVAGIGTLAATSATAGVLGGVTAINNRIKFKQHHPPKHRL